MGELNPGWLRLPNGTEIILVDDSEKLERSSDILGSAYVCGIDAEWEPYTKPFAASLVQLAVRCHGGGEFVLLVVRENPSTCPVLAHLHLGAAVACCLYLWQPGIPFAGSLGSPDNLL